MNVRGRGQQGGADPSSDWHESGAGNGAVAVAGCCTGAVVGGNVVGLECDGLRQCRRRVRKRVRVMLAEGRVIRARSRVQERSNRPSHNPTPRELAPGNTKKGHASVLKNKTRPRHQDIYGEHVRLTETRAAADELQRRP